MIKDISNFIEELVQGIDSTLIGKYDPINEYTTLCDSKYSRKGKYVTDISDNKFLISDLDPDKWIKAGDATGVLKLPDPYFLSGTRISANREWTISTEDLTKKTPIVWLLSDIRYFQYGRDSAFDWESEIRIFFLDEGDAVNYYSADYISNVVYPMSRLAELFIDSVKKNRKYKTLDQWEIINFTRFGTEDQSGYVQNIIDANLSGVELRISLTKYKENCTC
tara:strand:+ start:1976 stop:2641 length:666 start_codon:yes stop_codon:yes gene_type:complete